jgi:hypothetical protein
MAQALAARPAAAPIRTRHRDPSGAPKYVNRLIVEPSPYLQQHAHNPVDWRPWGEDPFRLAEKLQRPVLLSVGYSTCHWCHVMEEESFEDEEIARYINENYVAIKVDREELPDVDAEYMAAVIAGTGRGGWPMTVWLTSDRQPFYASTYLPPRDGDRGVETGFLTQLRLRKEAYSSDRAGVVAKSAELTRTLAQNELRQPSQALPPLDALGQALGNLLSNYDEAHGGFGKGNKFPRPPLLEFLVRLARRTQHREAKRMSHTTLQALMNGGIYDHVEGGFFRYTVDPGFRVPHFEKMLFDNAQLASVFLEAYGFWGQPELATVARQTLDYLLTQRQAPTGGFWAATDADSDGGEGRFATFTPDEVRAALPPELASIALEYYGITDKGSVQGRSVPFVSAPIAATAQQAGLSVESYAEKLREVRALLRKARLARPQPHSDDKIIVAWNGLAIRALARAAFILDEPKYGEAARRAADFLLHALWDGKDLARYAKGDKAFGRGTLDDYTGLTAGLLALFQWDGDPRWLQAAKALQAAIDTRFRDEERGGYFLAPRGEEHHLFATKPSYDGGEPSGNSVAALNLLTLWHITSDDAYRATLDKLLMAFGESLAQGSTDSPLLLAVLEARFDLIPQVLVVRPAGQDDKTLLDALRSRYTANRILVRTALGQEHTALAAALPWVADKLAPSGSPTAYICYQGSCQRPTSNAEELRLMLRDTPLLELPNPLPKANQ